MKITKVVNREPKDTIKFGSKLYRYQCGARFLDVAEGFARHFREEGYFVKIVKYQKPGHPLKYPSGRYHPSYLIYIRPKKTKR